MADRTSGPQGSGGRRTRRTPRRGFFTRNPLLLAILAVLALLAISNYFNTHNQVELTFSEFRSHRRALPDRTATRGPQGPTTQSHVGRETGFGNEPIVIGPQTIIGKFRPTEEEIKKRRSAAARHAGR